MDFEPLKTKATRVFRTSGITYPLTVALSSGRGSSVIVVLVCLFHLIFICITYFGLIGAIKKGLFYDLIPAL